MRFVITALLVVAVGLLVLQLSFPDERVQGDDMRYRTYLRVEYANGQVRCDTLETAFEPHYRFYDGGCLAEDVSNRITHCYVRHFSARTVSLSLETRKN